MFKYPWFRQHFKFMRGNILVLSLTRMLGRFCRGAVFPYASLYILALGGDPTQIGFVNALKPLAGLVMFPIGGFRQPQRSLVRATTSVQGRLRRRLGGVQEIAALVTRPGAHHHCGIYLKRHREFLLGRVRQGTHRPYCHGVGQRSARRDAAAHDPPHSRWHSRGPLWAHTLYPGLTHNCHGGDAAVYVRL